VYDRQPNGRELTLAVRGSLMDRDEWRGPRFGAVLVFYDRETRSCWWEGTGKCLTGPLTGQRLEEFPAEKHVTWADWRRRHPETLVFSWEGREE